MSQRQAEKIIPKGLSVAKATSLADLHRRRAETQSQYFSPKWVSVGIWSALSELVTLAQQKNYRLRVIDSSCGNGRLLEPAPSEHVSLYGVDIDPNCISALVSDYQDDHPPTEFDVGSLAQLEFDGMDLAIINPPFSIHLDDPNLTPYRCNHFGRFGPLTSALSHEYALEQALKGAQYTAAILPSRFGQTLRADRRLMAIYHLPNNAFHSEGANVKTAVYFLCRDKVTTPFIERYVTETELWEPVTIAPYARHHRRVFRWKGYDTTEPTITTPVTHLTRVELHHHNRQIVLKFSCGFTEAKVLNALYKGIADGKRLPKSVRYIGQGRLMLDVLLLQPNPEIALTQVANKIKSFGGEPWVSPTLENFYRKLVRRHQRAITPFFRSVLTSSVSTVRLQAKRRGLLDPNDFNSPVIHKDQFVTATPHAGEYTLTLNDHSVTLRRDELLSRYTVISESDLTSEKNWTIKHAGLSAGFPELAFMYRRRIASAGIDWLANFQADSLVEGLINPYGYIGAWEQGSGKARYSIALALLHSGKNLIVVESGLMPEMIREFEKLKIDRNWWSVLKKSEQPHTKISLTAYTTLRAGYRFQYKKSVKKAGQWGDVVTHKITRTMGQQWKRLFNLVICDEGGLLCNLHTQQTRAVKALSAKKLIILDGTPIRNYPRNTLPLAVASAGNGTSHQPYGVNGKAKLSAQSIQTLGQVQRGEDAFFEQYVVTQWVTNQFKEDLQSGGKREVPKINNVRCFRDWLAPNIQRRLRCEPELAIFANCPTPTRQVITCDWDESHLNHYLTVALDFVDWFKKQKNSATNMNMVAILARINAVLKAANAPHVDSEATQSVYNAVTSKQRLAIKRIKYYVEQDRKVIVYARSPDLLERLQRLLSEQSVKCVLFTGQQAIKNRSLALERDFRQGDTPVLLSSWVGQRGLNLEQASVVIFYERSWSSTNEEQAVFRTQRPTQTEQVAVEYLHLRGSIDEYCAQLVEWKQKAAQAGLDFGEQIDDEDAFIHLDTILTRFCDNFFDLSVSELREVLNQ